MKSIKENKKILKKGVTRLNKIRSLKKFGPEKILVAVMACT